MLAESSSAQGLLSRQADHAADRQCPAAVTTLTRMRLRGHMTKHIPEIPSRAENRRRRRIYRGEHALQHERGRRTHVCRAHQRLGAGSAVRREGRAFDAQKLNGRSIGKLENICITFQASVTSIEQARPARSRSALQARAAIRRSCRASSNEFLGTSSRCRRRYRGLRHDARARAR